MKDSTALIAFRIILLYVGLQIALSFLYRILPYFLFPVINSLVEYVLYPVALLLAIRKTYSDETTTGAKHAFEIVFVFLGVQFVEQLIFALFFYPIYFERLEYLAGKALIAFITLTVAASWRYYQKAGRQGWESLLPVYNTVVQCKIAGVPGSWVWLFLIPIANFYFVITMFDKLAKSFGKTSGFTAGLVLLPFIFVPILGFDESVYKNKSLQFSGSKI